MSQKKIGNKIPIYKLKTTNEVMKYYDEWGKGINTIKICSVDENWTKRNSEHIKKIYFK